MTYSPCESPPVSRARSELFDRTRTKYVFTTPSVPGRITRMPASSGLVE